ncbi:hypothetical protein JCM8547_008124 [Rhodosporidiobolus lusitaniae]
MAERYPLRSRKSAVGLAPASPASSTAVAPSSSDPSTTPAPSPSKPAANGGAAASETKQPAKKEDPHGDADLEFGGWKGTLAMMVGFPALFYYLFTCLYFNDGHFRTPADPSTFSGRGGWSDFLHETVSLVVQHAAPTMRATTLYLTFVLLQLVLAFVMPGVKQKGLPLPHQNNLKLDYYCNAYTSTYATIALVAGAHYLHLGGFHLSEAIDLYGPLLTVASISGFSLAAVIYLFGENYRMTGNPIYDYFMGSTLNPRIGIVDIKMFAEIRISWTILFAFAMANVVKQWEEYGRVSGNAALFAWGVFIYLNACLKGEQYIPQTWDMNFEKFGWLLSYWNFAGVPFSYCYPALWMATHDPATYEWSTPVLVGMFVVVTAAQALMDISMAQKSHFKAVRTNTYVKRNAFPQWPYAELDNPKTFKTKRGELLVDGCWAYLRKPNYISDWTQAIVWGLSAGSGVESFIPYFYPVFHCTMLLHRNARDDAKCARKYGEDWEEYKRRVPYSYIYGLF